jgi:hypothetical protein
VHRHKNKLLSNAHGQAKQCANDEINDGNFDEVQAHIDAPGE